jgi:hypothetical protein
MAQPSTSQFFGGIGAGLGSIAKGAGNIGGWFGNQIDKGVGISLNGLGDFATGVAKGIMPSPLATPPATTTPGMVATRTAATSGLPSENVGKPAYSTPPISPKAAASPITTASVPTPTTPLATLANGAPNPAYTGGSTSGTSGVAVPTVTPPVTPPVVPPVTDTTSSPTDPNSYEGMLANANSLAVPGADEVSLQQKIAALQAQSDNAEATDSIETGGTLAGYLGEAGAQQQVINSNIEQLTGQYNAAVNARQNAYTKAYNNAQIYAPQKDANGNMIQLNPSTGNFDTLYTETAPAATTVLPGGSSLVTTSNGQVTSQTGGSTAALANLDPATASIVTGLQSNLGLTGQTGTQFANTVGGYLASGDLPSAQSAIESALPASTGAPIIGNRQVETQLGLLNTDMAKYYAGTDSVGGGLNHTGPDVYAKETLAGKFGTTTNPDLQAMNRDITNLNTLVNSADFTSRYNAGAVDYIAPLVPSIGNDKASNLSAVAKLQQLLSASDQTYLTKAIGPTAYNAIYGGGSTSPNSSSSSSSSNSGDPALDILNGKY